MLTYKRCRPGSGAPPCHWHTSRTMVGTMFAIRRPGLRIRSCRRTGDRWVATRSRVASATAPVSSEHSGVRSSAGEPAGGMSTGSPKTPIPPNRDNWQNAHLRGLASLSPRVSGRCADVRTLDQASLGNYPNAQKQAHGDASRPSRDQHWFGRGTDIEGDVQALIAHSGTGPSTVRARLAEFRRAFACGAKTWDAIPTTGPDGWPGTARSPAAGFARRPVLAGLPSAFGFRRDLAPELGRGPKRVQIPTCRARSDTLYCAETAQSGDCAGAPKTGNRIVDRQHPNGSASLLSSGGRTHELRRRGMFPFPAVPLGMAFASKHPLPWPVGATARGSAAWRSRRTSNVGFAV